MSLLGDKYNYGDESRTTKPKKILHPSQLHGYQVKAVNHQCSRPQTMLWLDMGLGKTPITLSSIAHLRAQNYLRGVLIVAPIRVCRLVWRQEAAKWSHTNHLTFSMMLGDKDMRTRALLKQADVYLTNYENLGWLATKLDQHFTSKDKPIPFNGLVWDEISKMKNSTTKRVTSFLRVLNHFDWRTGLTGTPASNGYKDLHGQFLVVDSGQRLGINKTPFATRFFFKKSQHVEVPFPDTKDKIKELISDITLEMSAEDYNPLPKLMVNDINLEMEGRAREIYDRLEAEFFAQLDSGKDVEAFNQAALTNKLLQVSNGAVYPVAGVPFWEGIHDLKLDALEEIIDEAQGNQVLCAYNFISDAERIMKRFAYLNPINITECKSEKALVNFMNRWKRGDCPLAIGHPASMGHGIDGLQDAGYIAAWFGLNWSLDFYDQLNARLRRQGQPRPVMCHRILVAKTMDQAVALRLDEKSTTQAGLRNAVKQYRMSLGA